MQCMTGFFQVTPRVHSNRQTTNPNHQLEGNRFSWFASALAILQVALPLGLTSAVPHGLDTPRLLLQLRWAVPWPLASTSGKAGWCNSPERIASTRESFHCCFSRRRSEGNLWQIVEPNLMLLFWWESCHDMTMTCLKRPHLWHATWKPRRNRLFFELSQEEPS